MLSETILVFAVLILILVIWKFRSNKRARTVAVTPDRLNSTAFVQETKAIILSSKSGPYTPVHDWPMPRISSKELRIRISAIGLNPIDWKCVTYGFGVHAIPWVSGREAAGTIEEAGADVHGFQKGDRVWVASTNYRDNRTSTFQEVCHFKS